MILLLKLIIITSLLVLGWTIATQDNMLLYHLREWANEKREKGNKWVEPLFLCHWCQPSVWSLLGYGFAYLIGVIHYFDWRLLAMYPLVAMGSSLVNGIIWGWHLKTDAETDYYKNKNAEDEYFTSAIHKAEKPPSKNNGSKRSN